MNSLLSRNEHVQKELNAIHKKCGLLIATGMGLQGDSLEELYLFLKEKVAGKENLRVGNLFFTLILILLWFWFWNSIFKALHASILVTSLLIYCSWTSLNPHAFICDNIGDSRRYAC